MTARARGASAPYLRSLSFTLLVPGSVAVYVPLWIASGEPARTGASTAAACALLLAGSALYSWCAWDFAKHGRGTPAPIDAPERLVVRGPYRWVRNPMYLAVLLAIAGWLAVFPTRVLLLYLLAVSAAFHAFVVGYEEPRLQRSFGGEYRDYCERVRRWVPRPPVAR